MLEFEPFEVSSNRAQLGFDSNQVKMKFWLSVEVRLEVVDAARTKFESKEMQFEVEDAIRT